MKKVTWKNASYPNAIPSWKKHPIKFKKPKTQVERVLEKLDYNKLAILGKNTKENTKMKKIRLKDLPKRKDLIGKKINITRQGGIYHYDYQDKIRLRTFLGAKFKIEKGEKWLYWNWKPEANSPDCGYSGITGKDLEKSYLKIYT